LNKDQIQYQILELKNDYIRIQGDLEKLESVGGSISHAEKRLAAIEDELTLLRTQLEKAE
jgi:ABC-type phosphate transport system auxiliary subunit